MYAGSWRKVFKFDAPQGKLIVIWFYTYVSKDRSKLIFVANIGDIYVYCWIMQWSSPRYADKDGYGAKYCIVSMLDTFRCRISLPRKVYVLTLQVRP